MDKYQYKLGVDTYLCPLAWKSSPYFHKLTLSPNTVTTISLLFAIFGGMFFVLNQHILSAFFVGVYYFLDCVDGCIARRYNQKSDFGEAYDFVKDAFLLVAFVGVLIFQFGFITIIPSIILILHLMSLHSTQEYSLDQNHLEEKENRSKYKLYLMLVRLYSKLGSVCSFKFMSTGDLILVSMLTIAFNNFLFLFVYSILIAVRYIIYYVRKEYSSVHLY